MFYAIIYQIILYYAKLFYTINLVKRGCRSYININRLDELMNYVLGNRWLGEGEGRAPHPTLGRKYEETENLRNTREKNACDNIHTYACSSYLLNSFSAPPSTLNTP